MNERSVPTTWRPIETAPLDAPILGWWDETRQWGIVEWDPDRGSWMDEYNPSPPPTCWQPLPEPPVKVAIAMTDTTPHRTVPVQVWTDVDEGIADFVRHMNTLPGIRTLARCQGTIGEGGAEPYGPQVMVSWEDDAARDRLSTYRLTVLGANFGYVHPEVTNDV